MLIVNASLDHGLWVRLGNRQISTVYGEHQVDVRVCTRAITKGLLSEREVYRNRDLAAGNRKGPSR